MEELQRKKRNRKLQSSKTKTNSGEQINRAEQQHILKKKTRRNQEKAQKVEGDTQGAQSLPENILLLMEIPTVTITFTYNYMLQYIMVVTAVAVV